MNLSSKQSGISPLPSLGTVLDSLPSNGSSHLTQVPSLAEGKKALPVPDAPCRETDLHGCGSYSQRPSVGKSACLASLVAIMGNLNQTIHNVTHKHTNMSTPDHRHPIPPGKATQTRRHNLQNRGKCGRARPRPLFMVGPLPSMSGNSFFGL